MLITLGPRTDRVGWEEKYLLHTPRAFLGFPDSKELDEGFIPGFIVGQ